MAIQTRQPDTWNASARWEAPSLRRDAGWGSVRRVVAALAAVPMLVAAVGLSGFGYLYSTIRLPGSPGLQQTTYLVDRSGRPITALHTAVDRTVIPFDQIPATLRDAVIAVEDKHYYSHGGVDPLAIARAAWVDFQDRSLDQGGSTITQQYVKTVFTGNQPTFARKVREAVLAIKLEHELTKDQILARYLNTIYFGHGAYGVQAAARTYFGRNARRLTLLQSATLAGAIARPTRFDPIEHPAAASVRRDYVLRQMVETGAIAPSRAAALSGRPVATVRDRPLHSPAAYFADYTRRYLESRFGSAEVFGGGLKVKTTLDLGWQRAAEASVRAYLHGPHDPAAALVAMDPRTGAIRAMVGGRNFTVAKFNLATQAHRQAGSAFKPFTLAAAIDEGISPSSMWTGPPSIVIPDRRCYTRGAPWHVSNYADESAGTMTLAQATQHSVNTIFAQLVTKVGPENVARMANRLGIQSKLQPFCSITLGSEEVTPLDMTAAFGTFAAQGVWHKPTPVQVVRGPDGTVIDRPLDAGGSPVLWPNHATIVTDILRGVVTSGTGTAAAIGRPAAGKTGTAQDYTNAWFCGYVPQLVTCVWVGYPKGNIPMRNIDGFPVVYGGSIPALIWHRFMSTVTAGMPVQDFPRPSYAEFETPSPTPTTTPSPSMSPSSSPSPTRSPGPSPSASPTPHHIPTPTPSSSPSPPSAGAGSG